MTLAAPALAGVRVLDFSRMLSGPFCTALLADLGADVIKIESPGGGDDARHFAPKSGGESCLFMMVNRNKRSVALDLKSEAGRQVAHRLAERSDIVVENFRPGVARRLGVDYASLAAINRRLVYASISGFGQEGPLAHRPAYDIIAQAMGGIMSVNGSKDGPPTRVGESLGDLAAGLYAAWAILAGLRARERDGHGQHLDIAMLDSIFSLLVSALSQYLFTGEIPGRIGNANPISAPLDSFHAADGELIIAVANDVMFRRLCQAMDAPE
ncbi:MAG: CaiB/BaiF CoA transferase family protein, partial [Acetobacteraceae bacterium]